MDQGKATTESAAAVATPADATVVAPPPKPAAAPKAPVKPTGAKPPLKPGAKPKAPPTFLSSFIDGVTHPTLPAVIGTLSVALAWFLACLLLVTPANLAKVDARYFMTVPEDDYTEVSLRAFRIAQQKEKPPFAVAILGTSGTRESIYDEKIIEEAVGAELKMPAPCYFLAAKALSLYEIAGLMDQVGDGFRGIVMVHVGPNALSDSGDARGYLTSLHRLAFQNEVYDEELRRVGLEPASHTGNYFLDNWRFFSARTNADLLRHLVFGPPDFKRHRYVDKPPLRDNAVGWKAMVKTAKEWMNEDAYRANRQANKELLDRMTARLRKNGRVELVLVEVPRHPELSTELIPPALDPDHRAFMRRWATEPGVHYFELDDEAELTADDLEDYIHLRSPAAQVRYTKVLAEKLRSVAATWKEGP